MNYRITVQIFKSCSFLRGVIGYRYGLQSHTLIEMCESSAFFEKGHWLRYDLKPHIFIKSV
jgi:hypothetical protein